MIERIDTGDEHLWAYKASGKITYDEYVKLEPDWMDALKKGEGKVKVLVEMDNIKLPEVKAMLEDLKMAFKLSGHIKACCAIGDHSWESWWVKLASALFPFKIKYFDHAKKAEAWEWIRNA